MRKILISIKPKYVRLILLGEKLYEYRKRIQMEVSTVVIYATAPVKQIVGEFKVDDVLSMSPEELWDKTNAYSGLTKDKFFKYFDGESIAHALSIKDVVVYEAPLNLSDINVKRAPQSWQYLY